MFGDGKRVPSAIHNVARDYSPVTPEIRGGLLDRNLRTRSRARIPPQEGDLAHAMAASDPEKLMIKADKLTRLSLTRWSADWKGAVVLYEQAANGFRLAKNYEKAKAAFEKASRGQEMLSSTRLSLTRWSADWKGAVVLYEQAANGFRLAKNYEKAKAAFEKASRGQEMLSSPWDAAKHMESAAALAKELSNWSEVADFYRRASELYIECGRSQPASDALAKGARVLEDNAPDEAIRLYTDACEILEEDGKEQMAFDLYRAATSVYIKLEKYEDAATFLLRLGLAADKCNATHSQCKAYLSAIIVYLYANDFKQAEKCYNDCCQIDAFLNSDQNRCASKLFSAYTDGDVEEIKRVAQSSTVKNLDHVIIRLAKKLPTGEVSAMKAEQEEALDEDDLT